MSGFLTKRTTVMKFYSFEFPQRTRQIWSVRSAADSGCCGKASKAGQGYIWPSLCHWLSLEFSCLEERQWAGVAGEETETRTIDLNLNTIQKKTINSRRKNTGGIYLGGSENIKFFQVTSGGVIEEICWKHTERAAVSSQWVLWHAEVLDIYHVTHILQMIKSVNAAGLLQLYIHITFLHLEK